MAVLSIAEYARRALLAQDGRDRAAGDLIFRLLLLIGKPFEPPALPPTQATRAAPLRSTGVTSRGATYYQQADYCSRRCYRRGEVRKNGLRDRRGSLGRWGGLRGTFGYSLMYPSTPL